MKSILVLVLSCLPLGALTVWSFVELGSIEQEVATEQAAGELAGARHTAEAARDRAKTERRVVDRLAAADFFAGQPVAALEALPETSSLRSAADAWDLWTEARQIVDKFFDVDRMADTEDLDQLKQARSRLEGLGTAYASTALRGRHTFGKLVEQNCIALDEKIARLGLQAEATARLGRAREAFQAQEHAECVTLCDDLLGQYAGVLDPAVVASVRLLCRRAQFWGDTELLFGLLESAEDLSRRKTLLEGFLRKHSGMEGRTSAEERILQQCAGQLREVSQQMAAMEKNRLADEAIRSLTDDLPEAYDERIGAAARVLERYPDQKVRSRLCTSAVAWLDEYLPAKAIEEHDLLQEAETSDGQIVRGFFKKVEDLDGKVVGYKRYPTYEQFVNPTSEVGTFRVDQLAVLPGTSEPRRCVEAYNNARSKLLDRLDEPESWSDFAALCERSQARLEAYRRKPGSSDEALSFTREASFGRSVLEGSAMDSLQALFGG